MRIAVQITLEPGGGESETIEVARLERGSLRPDTLGLSLVEARAILAGLEQNLVEAASGGICRPRAALFPVRPAPPLQRPPPNRVSHAFWQAPFGQPPALSLPVRGARTK